jgi:hypothetical protein
MKRKGALQEEERGVNWYLNVVCEWWRRQEWAQTTREKASGVATIC